MTREEEINRASRIFAYQLCFSCLDVEICEKIGIVCPEFRESLTAFSEGAKWADEHPIKHQRIMIM